MAVYLDYNATTPVDPAVLEAMLPFLGENFGNAGSVHSAGQRARAAVDAARESVAALIGAKPSEIVFTSGGTEADNLAIFGTVAASAKPRKHVITTSIEHHAILHSCEELERQGIDVTVVPVGRGPNSRGVVDPEEIRRALRPETVLITVMHANNELGTIQPIEEISRIAAEAGVRFHCDAVQSAGKVPLDVNRLGVDLLSISAHKFYGPKGVGALYVRTGTNLAPRFFGGHAERDRRAGTENVPGIVGIGKAAELARMLLAEDAARIAPLRDRLESALLERIPSARVNGDRAHRVPNTTNISFPGAGWRSAADRTGSPGRGMFHRRGLFLRFHRAIACADRRRPFARRCALEPALQPRPPDHRRRNRSRHRNDSRRRRTHPRAFAASPASGGRPRAVIRK